MRSRGILMASTNGPEHELDEDHSMQGRAPRGVLHVVGSSAGGIRSHVAYLASHPPPGFSTVGVAAPPELADYFGQTFLGSPGFISGRLPAADILHAHGLTAGIRAVSSLAPRRARPALVITVHTSQQQTLRVQVPGSRLPLVQAGLWRAALALVARADALVAVSEEVGAQVGASHVVAPATRMPLPDAGNRDQTRLALGTQTRKVVVLAACRLHHDKNLGVLIDAVRGSGAEGWIAGEGPERRRLEELASGSGVRLLGQREDIPSLLGAADIFALPAKAESYGLAVMEAVSAGLPVVATRTGGIAELVGDGGLLVEPGDAGAFVQALRRLIDDPQLRQRLASRARARRLPSAAELTKRLGEVYEEALTTRAARHRRRSWQRQELS